MGIAVRFVFFTGITRTIYSNARLLGSWDRAGKQSQQWSAMPMALEIAGDGSICFSATIEFDPDEINKTFHWGVIVDGPAGPNQWGVATEINATASSDRYRSFVLSPKSAIKTRQEEHYYLSHHRFFGAVKQKIAGQKKPGIRFAVWAPYAEKVEVVFGGASGYIADDGSGALDNKGFAPILLSAHKNGLWMSETLPDFSKYEGKCYLYRITKEGGKAAYRTDLYARSQIGRGELDPKGASYSGKPSDLLPSKSCSLIVDTDSVTSAFNETNSPKRKLVPEKEFWKDEFTPGKPLPKRVEELVIYELNIGALGAGQDRPGNFEDAVKLLDYLLELGVNGIEILPFDSWGAQRDCTTHYFAMDSSAGSYDQFKHFVRQCHRYGIAVILSADYSHYSAHSERAQWAYDSDLPEHNSYFWYKGDSAHYAFFNQVAPDNRQGHGGYIENRTIGYAPRYCEEMNRKLFISSAVAMIEHFHIDGFKLENITSIHAYNTVHADGSPAGEVNIFGAKFLRELSRTLKMIKPDVFLIADDHSEWNMVAETSDKGGLGFDAVCYANFYYHLIGNQAQVPDFANLLRMAGYGRNQPLAMDYFAGALLSTANNKIVFHASHARSDDSMRTIEFAVNQAPLIDETRRVAEARCRFAAGMAMLSAGTPLFLMGEEVGAVKNYVFSAEEDNREDLYALKDELGAYLFRFYSELIAFRLKNPGLRTHNIDIIHIHNDNRVIVFRRWGANQEFIIAASLNNKPFASGYVVDNNRVDDGRWVEAFNSDASLYEGNNIGNYGITIPSLYGKITIIIPANGFVVLQRER
jgi:1,4-alpha-glucan branching enzyme